VCLLSLKKHLIPPFKGNLCLCILRNTWDFFPHQLVQNSSLAGGGAATHHNLGVSIAPIGNICSNNLTTWFRINSNSTCSTY
jgi:hypothetical protein